MTSLFLEFLLRLALSQFKNSQYSIKSLEMNLLDSQTSSCGEQHFPVYFF